MQKKKIILAVLVIILIATGAYTFSNGSMMQGKFGSVKSTTKSTTATPSPFLTVTADTIHSDLIDLSEIDFDYDYDETDPFDVDPTWFTVGKFTTTYNTNVSACGDIQLAMNDGSTTFQYQSWFDYVFDDVRLQYRTSSDVFVGYIYASDSGLRQFDTSSIGASGNGYFEIDVKAKEDTTTTYFNKNLYIYVNNICAEKNGTKYYWDYKNRWNQNSYFNITADNTLGLTVGSAKVQE